MKYTYLVVGLGNPEGKYFQTYHNVGFLTAESLAEQLKTEFKKKGNQLLAVSDNVLILKPLTYMNLSGQAVVAAVRKHRIDPKNVIVFTDDLYIEKGNIRIAFGGSSAGHNGIKSITELLGTNQYIKIRIGIQPEKPVNNNADYVLSKIDADSRILIDKAIGNAVCAAVGLTSGEPIEKFQGKFNTKNAGQTNV